MEQDIVDFLTQSKRLGGIFGFSENYRAISLGIREQSKTETNLYEYILNRLESFNALILIKLEKYLYKLMVVDKIIPSLSKFTDILHDHIKESYLTNLQGEEAELWKTNGKSLDVTLHNVLKKYDPSYIDYLFIIGYNQLANLCFDTYIYYHFIGDNEIYISNIHKYKEYLKNEFPVIQTIEV